MPLGSDPFDDENDQPRAGDPEIDLTEPEPDDDEDDAQARPQPGAQAATGKQKRRNRFKEAQERAAAAEATANELRVQMAQMQGQMQALGQVAIQQQSQQNRGPDPIDEAEESITREREVLYQQYSQRSQSGNMTPEEQKEFIKKSRELENKQFDVHLARRQRQGALGQPQVNPQQQALATYMQMTYPELSDKRVDLYADGEHRKLVAQGWPAYDKRTLDEAMKRTRSDLRIQEPNGNGHTRTPDPAMRDRLQGTRSGGGGASGKPEGKVTMTKPLRQMAERMYPKLAPEAAYRKYAQEVMSAPDDE